MVYDITLGASRTSQKTSSYQWEWSEVVARLKAVQKTAETAHEYKSMTKQQRIDAKDVGFFIGGRAEGRKVNYRQIISLDIDESETTTLDDIRKALRGCAYVIHTTHSSTPDAPRYRVVAPLSRIVCADEYGALMRVLSEQFGLPLDASTFDFNRIMFLPSTPRDVDYYIEEMIGEPIDVDATLAKLPDWKDLSDIPVPKIQVQNPKYKGGMVGAFCAKFTIREAIATYLSDVWKIEPSGRYTFHNATTIGGGVIYEDAFLYSNHSSDPYMGHCYNAYDAVRLYKFGEGKQGEAGMLALCEQLGLKPVANKQFKATIDALSDSDAKAILNEKLELDKSGNLLKTLNNADLILTYDPSLKDVFAYDLFSETPVLKRTPFWRDGEPVSVSEDCVNIKKYADMTDTDESYLRLYFENNYGFDARAVLNDALNITEHRNAFHPVRDYLSSLKWDGVERLATIFIDCFGVEDTLYAREVGIKFFVGAVRRVFIPAAKMDYVPVLVSEEGLGKSKFIRRMAKVWGSDTFYTFNGSKEAYEQLRGVWIMEIPELNGVQNRSTNGRKAFITKGEDRYRAAYLKYTKTYKRQCVFIASSNDVIFLDDPSEDGRRWWGLMCEPARITIDVHSKGFLDLVDKYWAEAVHYYMQGVLPVLSDQAEAEARCVRQTHKAEDVEEGALAEYLNMPVPENWDRMTVYERRQYITEPDVWNGTPRDYICTPEVAREFFEYERCDLGAKVGRRVADAIRRTKLFEQTGKKKYFTGYGSVLVWKRRKKL